MWSPWAHSDWLVPITHLHKAQHFLFDVCSCSAVNPSAKWLPLRMNWKDLLMVCSLRMNGQVYYQYVGNVDCKIGFLNAQASSYCYKKKKNPFGCNCQLFICRGEADEVGGGFAVRDISSQLNSITACNLFMTAIKASRPQWELKKITKLGQRCSKLTAMDNSEPRSTKAFEMHANRYAMLFGYKTASFPYKLASVQSKPFHQCLISQRKMLKKYITSYCNSSKIVYTVQWTSLLVNQCCFHYHNNIC